jgi:hypothetical protein
MYKEHITYQPKTAVIDLPHNGYVDWLLRSDSIEYLMKVFKTADSPSKEISESMSALLNLRKYTRISDSPWLHIGDGAMARTAQVFALFSKAINYSIDPLLKTPGYLQGLMDEHEIKKVVLFKSGFENVLDFCIPLRYNITCVHAHVDTEEVDKKFPNWTFLYSNPCCYPEKQTFSDDYMHDNNIINIVDKIDLGILSERRRVLIYKKNNPTPKIY